MADFVLWYARDKNEVKYTPLYREKQLGSEGTTQYKHLLHPGTGEFLLNCADESAERPDWSVFAFDNLTSQSPRNDGQFPVEIEGKTITLQKGYWKTNPEGMARLGLSNRLKLLGNTVMYRRYLADFSVNPISNVWRDVLMTGFSEEKLYVVQTSQKIIERCLLMTTMPGDLVLDPTCGSGTTAYVAEQWGRRWITMDTSRIAISLTRQRLLTARYDFYRLRDETKGVSGQFRYKTVPHIGLRSIAQNRELDAVFAKHEPELKVKLGVLNEALVKVPDTLRAQLQAKLADKERREGKNSLTDADRRRWLLPKQPWREWDAPLDSDTDYPAALATAVGEYRAAWKAKMDEVNSCIAANAKQEELVDKPEIVKNVLRVSGPFTVEGVMPEELSLFEEGLFDGTPNEWEEGQPVEISTDVQNLRAYLGRMVELLRKDGVLFSKGDYKKFDRIEALFEQNAGNSIHAEGIWQGARDNTVNSVAVAFGPQYGPVSAMQVEELIRSSRRYDELVIAGFSFDASASELIQENKHPKLHIHMAHIRPDVSPGMDGLLKDTPNSQLFTVFGQPELKVHPLNEDEAQIELLGVDIYDPVKGEVRASGAERVKAWFLDSDYDGRCFCITQAFFPDQDSWNRIAKSLGSEAKPDAFEAFKGTKSVPFKIGQHRRIAVKVIDPRGNEVMAIASLK